MFYGFSTFHLPPTIVRLPMFASFDASLIFEMPQEVCAAGSRPVCVQLPVWCHMVARYESALQRLARSFELEAGNN